MPDTEQQAIAVEIFKRVINFDVPPLTDEDLVLNAEEILLALDEEEADYGIRGYITQCYVEKKQ